MKTTALPLAFSLLALCLLVLFLLPPTAAAEMIGTGEVIAEQSVQADRDKVREFLDRANVQERLQVMDVPAALARSRVDALTPTEAATLAQRIDAMPAAGALSGHDFIVILLVAILVVLII